MKRRKFIKNAAAITAGAVAAPYIMKGVPLSKKIPNDKIMGLEDENIIIIIELFGGNDGLNTIVPMSNYDTYREIRPRLYIPQDMLYPYDKFYMSPFIVDGIHNGGMKNLMDSGRLAIIEGIGYENPTLSHFRSQDIILSGVNNSNSSVKLLSGWVGRYFANKLPNFPEEIPEHPLAISIDGTVPLIYKSSLGHMGIALKDPDDFYELGQGLTPMDPLMSGTEYYPNEYNFVHTIARQCEEYSTAIKEAYDAGVSQLKVDYSEGLPEKMRTISALIAGGLQTKVYHVRLSNFDFHAQQMTEDFEGQHPTLIRQVANAICEFMDDAQQQGWADRVAGMTISEFGRRPYDNASRGTDHGAASMQFVFGNYVEAGYYGDPPKLEEEDLDDAGNVVYQKDFRMTYEEFLKVWFGATDDDITDVFGETYGPVGVLRPRDTAVEFDYLAGTNVNDGLSVVPNPAYGSAALKFELKRPADIKIEVFKSTGQLVKQLYSGYMSAGYKEISINVGQSGTMLAVVTVGKKRYFTKFSNIR